MAEPTRAARCPGATARVDTLFNLAGVHVTDVAWRPPEKGRERLVLRVAISPGPAGCSGCGVLAAGSGRRVRRLHDIPAFGAPVGLVWRQRRHRCAEPACPVDGFSEDSELAEPRAKLTGRAAWWAISCLQTVTASVASVARRNPCQCASRRCSGMTKSTRRPTASTARYPNRSSAPVLHWVITPSTSATITACCSMPHHLRPGRFSLPYDDPPTAHPPTPPPAWHVNRSGIWPRSRSAIWPGPSHGPSP